MRAGLQTDLSRANNLAFSRGKVEALGHNGMTSNSPCDTNIAKRSMSREAAVSQCDRKHAASLEYFGNRSLFGALPTSHVLTYLFNFLVAQVVGAILIDATYAEWFTDTRRCQVERL